jgi:Tfp pilus assembly protein PilF
VDVSVSTKSKIARAAVCVVALVAVSCTSLLQEPAPSPQLVRETRTIIVPSPKPSPTPMAGLSDSERLNHAVSLLEQGQPERARVELQEFLRSEPDNAAAKRLLSHIDTPLAELFPEDNFTIQLRGGESLFSISGEYLGDSFSFYALARYNDITNPSRVAAGLSIKIPAVPRAFAARNARQAALAANLEAEQIEEPTPDEPWNRIASNIEAGRYGAAILEAESEGVMPDGEKAAVLAHAYAGVARELESSAKLLAGSRALRAGQLYLDADRPRDALLMFDLALRLTPASTTARALRDQTRARVVDAEYQAGLLAFQRQQLDDAIAHFDQALEIDPTHRDATTNRAQAIEMRSVPN